MDFSAVKLPPNRKFGLFFAGVFTVAFLYFSIEGVFSVAWVFAGLAIFFAALALTKPDALLPLNKLWMRLGLLLGLIVSPIVLGAIFFVLFTPMGFLIRILGRDELRLQAKSADSYWKVREPNGPPAESFKNQF